MTKQEKGHDSYQSFMDTLNVVNKVMENYRDTPIIKDILSLVDNRTAGRKFGVAVYDKDPDKPFDYFTIRLNNQRLELVAHGKDAPDIDWKVSIEYLEDVSENPDNYIDNPLKLDLEWLKHRLRDVA
jgi:hypothetical protein